MKTLIINGSPRERTHASMISALERGLTGADSEVTKRSVYKLDIRPCLACTKCMRETPGVCAQEDDMASLLPLVAQSDLLMLVTPVYLDGMTGKMKVFIDRLIPLLEWGVEMRDGRVRHPIREGVKRGKVGLMSASTFPEPETHDPLVAHVKAICGNLGREYAGEILVPGRGHLARRGAWDAVLGRIESAGAHLVKEGKIPEDFLSDIVTQISPADFVRGLNAYIAKLP